MPHEQVSEQGALSIIDAPRRVSLAGYDPSDTGGITREEADAQLPALQARLRDLQEALFGAAHQAVLVILQGMDTSGKDGTIKHVMDTLNPVGCQVSSFKQPSAEELARDFLWRIHKCAPAKGVLGIFNRSQYEDVLIVRVHNLVPPDVWEPRYTQINNFEQMLSQNGTLVFKFILHISKDEQKQRLLAREQHPRDWWKLSLGDWQERASWDAYQQAYEDALGRCGAPWAPWFIVPANHKWYRNYIVAKMLVERLTPYEVQWRAELDERGEAALKAIHDAHAHERYG